MAFVAQHAWPRPAAAILMLLMGIVGTSCSTASAQDLYGDRGWIGVEYLRWQTSGSDLPPLVTFGPDGDPDAGELGDPDTDILFGDETVGDDWRNGYRIYGGVWLDDCHCCALVADYFDLDNDFGFLQGDEPGTTITRPFFNAETGEPDTQLVSVPDELSGTVEVSGGDDFSGAGIAIQHPAWRCCDPCGAVSSLSLLGGYRHYSYDSDLVITENLLVLPNTMTPLVPGTTIFLQDEFHVQNEFHGGEIGIQGVTQPSWWWIDGLAKFALGSHRRVVTIDGQTITNVPGGGTATAAGGLLTSEVTNIGEYADQTLAIIPQFRLGVGGHIWKGISLRAGYNLIIWNGVATAGQQLPPGLEVDPRNLPPVQPGGGPEPEFRSITGSHFVAHGLDLAVQWAF
jgi:hypothetical protein